MGGRRGEGIRFWVRKDFDFCGMRGVRGEGGGEGKGWNVFFLEMEAVRGGMVEKVLLVEGKGMIGCWIGI